MRKMITFLLTLCFCAILIGCTEAKNTDTSVGEVVTESPVQTAEPVVVPADKAEAYTFSGTWKSDDEQTVLPILVHLYEDGSVVLESHENQSGSWKKNEDGTLGILIGEESYTAKYSEYIKTTFFRLNGKMGDENYSIQMTLTQDPAKVAEDNNNALIASLEKTMAKEEYTGDGGEIIFYGGSNFQKWTTLEDDLKGYPVVNKSIGGSNDVVRRHFAEERVYSRKPAAVFYMSSTNDWTSGQSKEDIMAFKQELFDEMGERLPDTVFVILSATPNPLRYYGEYHDGMVEVDKWTESYCAEHDHFEFLNVVPALSLNDGAEPNKEIWQSDRLHLTEDGYVILTELVREKIEEIQEKYSLTFAEVVEIEDDGPGQRVFWSRDWMAFENWTQEDWASKEVAFQFTGNWEMEGEYSMAFYFLAELYGDGSLRIFQHSPTRGDNVYFGYWSQRDTEKGNRITLTTVSETSSGENGGLVPHEFTYRIFESNGNYLFGFDFGITPGAYLRAVDMKGSAGNTWDSVQSYAGSLE